MRKDATEFRLRFQRWKNGELVYENGRVIPHLKDGSDGFFDNIINTVHSAYNVNNNEQYVPEGLYRLYDVAKKDWELNNPNSLYTFELAMKIKRIGESLRLKNELIGPAPKISEYERNLNNLRGLAAAAYEQKLKDIQTGTQVLGALGTIARPSTWIAAPFRGVEHFGEGFGNELIDIPLDIAAAPAAKLAFKGIKSVSKALTPVRNIPYNSENFYRSVGKEAIEDANTTGIVRANPISEYAGPNFLLGSVPLFTRGRNYVIEAPKGSAETWVDAKAYERGLGNYGKPTIAEASAENPIAYPMTNGELSIPTNQASYWKKYPILGWRLKLFKTPTLELEVFPEGLLNDKPLIAGAVDNLDKLADINLKWNFLDNVDKQLVLAYQYKHSTLYKKLIEKLYDLAKGAGIEINKEYFLPVPIINRPTIVLKNRVGSIGGYKKHDNVLELDPSKMTKTEMDNVPFHEGLHWQLVGEENSPLYRNWANAYYAKDQGIISEIEHNNIFGKYYNSDEYLLNKNTNMFLLDIVNDMLRSTAPEYIRKPNEIIAHGLEAGRAIGLKPFLEYPAKSRAALDAMLKAADYDEYLYYLNPYDNKRVQNFWNILTGQFIP